MHPLLVAKARESLRHLEALLDVLAGKQASNFGAANVAALSARTALLRVHLSSGASAATLQPLLEGYIGDYHVLLKLLGIEPSH